MQLLYTSGEIHYHIWTLLFILLLKSFESFHFSIDPMLIVLQEYMHLWSCMSDQVSCTISMFGSIWGFPKWNACYKIRDYNCSCGPACQRLRIPVIPLWLIILLTEYWTPAIKCMEFCLQHTAVIWHCVLIITEAIRNLCSLIYCACCFYEWKMHT